MTAEWVVREADVQVFHPLAPGDVFSLNGYTGPRGAAQGYVESGIIINGREVSVNDLILRRREARCHRHPDVRRPDRQAARDHA